MKKDLVQLIDLKNEGLSLQASWYRQILTLASGGLALLVALQPDVPPEGNAKYFLASSWLFLGLGIVLGASATYAEVHNAKNLANAFAEKMQKCISEGRPHMNAVPVFAKQNMFYKACKHLMVGSLLMSVVCLVSFSTIKTLTPNTYQASGAYRQNAR